jgi:glycosyltransferase involved in cell wall biosynthesis
VTYVHEPEPGIAAARNAALVATARDRYVAFIDDDEVADSRWLSSLYTLAQESNADVVAGPVAPLFRLPPPAWIARGGFFDAEVRANGVSVPFVASNNTLVRRTVLDLVGAQFFDGSYSATGGSDSELFLRLSQKGAKMVWAANALVHETIGPERTTLHWIFRRAIREGNNTWRLGLAGSSRMIAVPGAVARILTGSAVCVVRIITMRTPTKKGLVTLGRGVGILTGMLSREVKEYAR